MIGILPAAGNATRINGLPKYLLPIPNTYLLDWHVQGMLASGCRRVFAGANSQNAVLLDLYAPNALVYTARRHNTMTQTIISGYVQAIEENYSNDLCLFGMPDTYWTDNSVYWRLAAQIKTGGHVAVALCPLRPNQYRSMGCVEVEGNQVTAVVDKPEWSIFSYGWGALAWTPPFWDYLRPDDPHVGYALPRAIEAGLDVRAVKMDGSYYDCGTPEGYFECVQSFEVVEHGA